MAKINDVDKAGKDIKNTFSEIGNLINELNSSLEKTFSLTKGVSDNLSQSNDLTREFMESEENLKGLKETLAGLDEDKQKRLEEAMKTGKGLTHELTKELGLQKHIGKLAGVSGKAKLEYLDKLIKKQDELNARRNKEDADKKKREAEEKKMEESINKLKHAAMDVFVTQLMAADKQTTEMARSLNISKDEAIGTGVVFSGEMLSTFSKLTKVVGISADAAGSLAFQGQMAGQSFREVEENVLGASFEMQRGVGIQLDMKGVLEATGKVSGQVRANLGATPELIAKAVTAAKLLGAELDTIVNAGKAQLDFESSIANEMEAELLTGKQLNLERMRSAALAGDQAAVAEELAKNVGTHGEFMKMNVLQQEALAKAMGMSTDSMADMLFKQETMGMNAKQLRAQGKDELADKLEQLDTQEKIALAQEKFQALIGDLATIFLPIVEGFGSLVGYIMESKVALGLMVGLMGALAIASVISAIANIFVSLSQIPLGLGIGLAVAASVGLIALIGTAVSSVGKVKDGFAPQSKGPFTIMDNYGGMARTTPGDNLQVGPGVGASSRGKKGLGGTQSLQATPTFA